MILSYPCSSNQGPNGGKSLRQEMNPSNIFSMFSFIMFLCSVNYKEIKSPQAQNAKVIRLFDPAPVFCRWVPTAKGKVVSSTTGLLIQARCSFYQWYTLLRWLRLLSIWRAYWLWVLTGNSLPPHSLYPPLLPLPISLTSTCSKIQWALVCKVLLEPQLQSSYFYWDTTGFILYGSNKIIYIFEFIFLQKFRKFLNCYALFFFRLVSLLLWNGLLFLSPLVDVSVAKQSLSCSFCHKGYLEGDICMPLPSDGVLQMERGCSGEKRNEKLDHTVYFISIL